MTAPQMVYSSTSKSASYLANRISQHSILRFCVAQHQILRFLVLPLAAMISALPLLKGANQLLSLLPRLCDPQSAIALLRVCASFCRLAHLARSIPPITASLEAFAKFDDVLHSLECSVEIDLTPRACNQAKLGLKYGGLGLRSLAMHAQAAYTVHCFLVYLINTNSTVRTDYAASL